MPSGEIHTVGFLGAGTMGSGMIASLLKGGLDVLVFDLDNANMQAVATQGARPAGSAAQVVAECEFVLCSLPSSKVFVQVAEVFLDFGTTTVPQTRRLAEKLASRGATLLDTPVSGSPRSPGFRIFVGGDAAAVQRALPVLHALTEPALAVHCGPSGAGQVVKGVNQLGMGLLSAACMEAVAFGVASGVSPEIILAAVGGDGGFRREIANMAKDAAAGSAERHDAKFAEWPYFLEHAAAEGLAMPLTQALWEFCGHAEKQWRDNMNRPYVSFWHRLMERTT
jgi:3-hydroxyisobutyrate dehydrogenase-like beta-hydroxyacid dehydrogenase